MPSGTLLLFFTKIEHSSASTLAHKKSITCWLKSMYEEASKLLHRKCNNVYHVTPFLMESDHSNSWHHTWCSFIGQSFQTDTEVKSHPEWSHQRSEWITDHKKTILCCRLHHSLFSAVCWPNLTIQDASLVGFISLTQTLALQTWRWRSWIWPLPAPRWTWQPLEASQQESWAWPLLQASFPKC